MYKGKYISTLLLNVIIVCFNSLLTPVTIFEEFGKKTNLCPLLVNADTLKCRMFRIHLQLDIDWSNG